MKIVASRELCRGHGQCEMFAPDYFQIDDDALVVVVKDEVAPEDVIAVEDAVGHCPEAAIRLERLQHGADR
ncbi:ferredoxin [Streptosporangium sp. CA-115845]|uniref:ferredoxin n=1 Tax=Streptosporangium sp. CA-115845 TaxID=3240071 RepID=UPI003D8ED68B